MLQFGTYTHSNRVEQHVPVAPLPPELERVVDRMVERGVISAEPSDVGSTQADPAS